MTGDKTPERSLDATLAERVMSSECPSDDSPWVRLSGASDSFSIVFEALKRGFEENGLKVRLFRAGSLGYGDLEPLLVISKPGRPALLYAAVTPDEAFGLADDYLTKNLIHQERAFCTMGESGVEGVLVGAGLHLFAFQDRVALRNCGLIDPEDIDRYLACTQGYKGLSKALRMDRKDVIETLRSWGLQGSDGTLLADKLQVVLDAHGDRRWAVCNGVDGEPCVSTSRLLLEGDPHAVLEGLLIAAYAAGADHSIICADERGAAGTKAISKALEEALSKELAGEGILDTQFSCGIEIRQAPASLVMGEETALLRFLEGKQAMPFLRSQESPLLSLFGKPAFVDSLESMARVAVLFRDFSAGSTDNLHGNTRLVTLSGDLIHPYVVEVPPFTTFRTLIEEIGGGVAPGRHIKAVALGGPLGRLLGPGDLDLSIDSVSTLGVCAAQSVTLEVFDSKRCSVELSEELMGYLHTQSCGKCVFCREGILQMSDILRSVAGGEGSREDLELLESLGKAMRTGSICAIGQGAANRTLNSLDLFRKEYDAHIREKRCPVATR